MSKSKLTALSEEECDEVEMLVKRLQVIQPKILGIFSINFKNLIRGIPDHGILPTRENLLKLREYAAAERRWESTLILIPHHGGKAGRNSDRAPINRLFHCLELISRILPPKIQKDTFEPAFNDAKKQYLQDRRKYKSDTARKWLAFCFTAHVVVMVFQCFWSMCGGKFSRMFLSIFSEILRRLLA